MVDLSIILPVHNESEVILRTLQEITHALQKQKISYEILCIVNGSTDDSYEKISKYAKRNKTVKAYFSQLGWGNAVKKGIKQAKGEYSLYMVSDGQVHASIIPKLYQLIQNSTFSMVKIKRITRENFTRSFNSRVFNASANLLLGIRSYDINGTPKIIKTALLKKVPFISPNISLDMELMLFLKKNELAVKEIPVKSYRRKGGKSTTNWKAVGEMYYYILKFLFTSL